MQYFIASVCFAHVHTHTHTGYYRVNYEPAIWKNIGAALGTNNHSSIHVLNRAQVRLHGVGWIIDMAAVIK